MKPERMKPWTESSLLQEDSNAACLPCHSWAVFPFKNQVRPKGKESTQDCFLLSPMLFSGTGTDPHWRRGGWIDGTKTFASLWPYDGLKVPQLLHRATRVSLSLRWGSTALSQLLSPAPRANFQLLWSTGDVTDLLGVSVCAHRRSESSLWPSCCRRWWIPKRRGVRRERPLQHQWFLQIPGSSVSNVHSPTRS